MAIVKNCPMTLAESLNYESDVLYELVDGILYELVDGILVDMGAEGTLNIKSPLMPALSLRCKQVFNAGQ
ncbi:MAG: hypothetical protein AAGB19_19000 [Cyanobacteria bacterium P01_F01_bin.3]